MTSLKSKLASLKPSAEGRLAEAYAKLRGSKFFLVSIATFILGWVTTHFVYHLDPDFGNLNLILSAEASIVSVFLTMILERQAKADKENAEANRKQLEYIEHLAEAQHAILATLKEHVIKASC